jgi:acetyl-CoA C-acetyltransferase
MRGEAAIVGINEVSKQERIDGVNERELVYRATKGAMDEAGLGRDELDTAVVAGNDILDGRTISNVYTAEAEAGFMKDETKVALDGLHAANYTVMRLLAQTHETAVVVAYGKQNGISYHEWSNLVLDPLRFRPLGVDGVHLAAMQARRLYETTDATPKDGARVAAKNLSNAQDNPHALTSADVSPEEVAEADTAATPLREPEVGDPADGAVAMVLTRAELAESYSSNPAAFLGVGHNTDGFDPARDAFHELRAASRAAEAAYDRAGLGPGDVDVAELTELAAPRELALVEALDLAKPGRAAQLLRDGETQVDGSIPVNPSGGAVAGHAYFAEGMSRLASAARQVLGEAPNQVDDVDVALAHGATGAAGEANAVALVGGPEEVGA